MKKLTSRVKHPIRYNVLRSAAAILLIILTLFGTLMAFSPEVRASVTEYVKEVFGVYVQYTAIGTPENTKYDYHLPAVPDGYREFQTTDLQDGKSYLYVNDAGSILKFIYAYGAQTSTLFIQTEFHTKVDGTVNGAAADIYVTPDESESNVIVWRDPETGTLLYLDAKMDKESLIALAESVTKTRK